MELHKTYRFRDKESGKWLQIVFAPVQSLLVEYVKYYDNKEAATMVQEWFDFPIECMPLRLWRSIGTNNGIKTISHILASLGLGPGVLERVETMEEKQNPFLLKSEPPELFLSRMLHQAERHRLEGFRKL